ncbi:MAG: ComF family protein [Patescibacteria group bacterium]|nr:ComF family protein [Patescibacteria group bacterium]
MIKEFKNFLLELFFPKFCLGCKREGSYLCEDCESIIDISYSHQKFQTKNLKDLYFATEYKSPLLKSLVQKFKYIPLIRELSKPLSFLIIKHFQLLDQPPPFSSKNGGKSDFVIVPIPLEIRKLRWRGFNQAEEIGKVISSSLEIPLINNILIKTKAIQPQVKLSEKGRRENILGVFSCQNQEKIKGRKIILVDDIYTTGSTMEEAARKLKISGAKEVTGLVIARAESKEDYF